MKVSELILFKSKKYYIENPKGKQKVFAYLDSGLRQVAKINGNTLIFRVQDLKDVLIK
jgi:hypothetical protein